MSNAELTPNVVVQNPTVRKAAQWVIGVAALVLPALAIVEAYTTVSFNAWLPAATAVVSFFAGVFGVAVIAPNIPTRRGDAQAVELDDIADAYADDGTGEIVDLDGDGDALDGSVEIGAVDAERAAEPGLGKYNAQ